MPTSLGFISVLLGTDSLIAGMALGTARPAKNRRWSLALLFAICDGAAFFLGSWMFPLSAARAFALVEWLGIGFVIAYALLILALARSSRSEGGFASDHRQHAQRYAFVVPFALSLDNFVAGMGNTSAVLAPAAAAVTIGVVSGGLALTGLWVGAASSRKVRMRSERLTGGALILFAGMEACREILF
jgi:manganese efflux pump family protein